MHPVARYDTAHGFFHLDLQTESGQVKYQVPIEDLGEAVTFAIDDLNNSCVTGAARGADSNDTRIYDIATDFRFDRAQS